jgi:hypothetical protein
MQGHTQLDVGAHQLAAELGTNELPYNMSAFERVTPAVHDPRLVIEAPSQRARRDLFMAIKKSRSQVRAHLHMTP